MLHKNSNHLLLLLLIFINIFGNINCRLIPNEKNIKINNQEDNYLELEATVDENNLNLNQPFEGYYPTSNIGIIPPKHANAGEYYNRLANLENKTFIINEETPDDSKKFEQKSIKNLLDSISKLHLMINTHDRKYQLINITKVDDIEEISITPQDLRNCGRKEEKTCGEENTPLCTEDKTLYCVKNFCEDDGCNSLNNCIASLVIEKEKLGEFTKHVEEGRKLQILDKDEEGKGFLCITKKGKRNSNTVEANIKKFCSNCDYNKNKQVENVKF